MADTTRSTSIEKSLETKKKVQNVIQHLITKENVLMISQDAKNKEDRYLSLDINVDMNQMNGMLQGNNEIYWNIMKWSKDFA